MLQQFKESLQSHSVSPASLLVTHVNTVYSIPFFAVVGGLEFVSCKLTTKVKYKSHCQHTGSEVALHILKNWASTKEKFVKVIPVEYKKALKRLEEQAQEAMIRSSVAA